MLVKCEEKIEHLRRIKIQETQDVVCTVCSIACNESDRTKYLEQYFEQRLVGSGNCRYEHRLSLLFHEFLASGALDG